MFVQAVSRELGLLYTTDTSIRNILLEPLWPVDSTFLRLVDTVSHLGGQIPQKPPKKGVNTHFQAKLAKHYNWYIIETTAPIPTKFCTVTKTNKFFVGGPNTLETNPRWRTAAILTNRKTTISPQKFDRSAHNLAWRRILAFPIGQVAKISNFYKFKMADGCLFKQSKNGHIFISNALSDYDSGESV